MANSQSIFEIGFEDEKSNYLSFEITTKHASLTESTLQHSCLGDIFYNDELDFLEVQWVNNIMKAAYKEFMAIAIAAKAWISDPPAVGAIEDFQEMFNSQPPHGYTVERSVETAILSISSQSLMSIMMDGVSYPQPDIRFQFFLFLCCRLRNHQTKDLYVTDRL